MARSKGKYLGSSEIVKVFEYYKGTPGFSFVIENIKAKNGINFDDFNVNVKSFKFTDGIEELTIINKGFESNISASIMNTKIKNETLLFDLVINIQEIIQTKSKCKTLKNNKQWVVINNNIKITPSKDGFYEYKARGVLVK